MTARRAAPRNKALVSAFSEIQPRIEAAMRALPAAHWRTNEIFDGQIETLAERYVYIAQSTLFKEDPPARGEVKRKRNNIQIAAKTLTRELMNLRGLALESLNQGVARAEKSFTERILTIGEVQAALLSLQLSLKAADIPAGAKSSRGRTKKTIQLEIAKAVARDFYTITGVAPNQSTKRGGFVSFLTEVLQALEMSNESPAALAKSLKGWWDGDRLVDDSPTEILRSLPSYETVEK
jgi:hypothetical protein